MSRMEINQEQFSKEVLENDLPVVVKFWGSWCPACKMSEEMVQRLREEYDGKVHVVPINVDKNPAVRNEFEIMGVPAYVFFHGGKEKMRLVGAQTESALRKGITRLTSCNIQ